MVSMLGLALAGCATGARRSATVATAPLPPLAPLATATSPPVPTTARAVTTSPAAATDSRSVAPAPGYTDTTPPPRIRATGSDSVAILRSLFAYRDWLFVHHPDPALDTQVFQRGTTTYARELELLTRLRSKRQTWVSIDQRMTYAVASVHGPLTTFRVHQTITEDRVLDRDRHVTWSTAPEPKDFVFVMTRDGSGRWRIADITQVELHPTIVISP